MILDEMAPRKDKKPASDPEDYDDEDYRTKRDRNNQAVKRSRFKSKQKAKETIDRINKLKMENEGLEDRVRTLSKELGFLRELFLAHAANAPGGQLDSAALQQLLAEDDEHN